MALIDLGSNLLDFCDFVQDSVRQKYYFLLTQILKRFELTHQQLEVISKPTDKEGKKH